MKYAVRFYNDVTKEIPCAMEFDIPRFTKRHYDLVLMELFEMASIGYENRSLFADVYRNAELADLKNIPLGTLGNLTIACETTTDGSEIWAHIFINSTHVRNMNIAS